jgi:hypothetical protein
MVKFILGEQGSGKTKWLIDNANSEIEQGNGNIAFIDVDDDHIFSLNYNVRLINAMEFDIKNIESFYGFLCGIVGMDYDLEKVYIDSIYKKINLDIETLEYLERKLNLISEKYNTEFYINVDYLIEDLPEHLREKSIQLEGMECVAK